MHQRLHPQEMSSVCHQQQDREAQKMCETQPQLSHRQIQQANFSLAPVAQLGRVDQLSCAK